MGADDLSRMFPNSPGMFATATPAPAAPPAAPAPAAPRPAPAPAPAVAAPPTREAQLRRMFPQSASMFPPVDAPPPADQGAPQQPPAAEAKPAAAAAPAAAVETPQTPTANPEFAAGLKTVAAELGLDDAKAGKVLELHTRVEAEQDKAFDGMVSNWRNATRTDQEIGGQAYSRSISDARALVNEFGTKELVAALSDSGMGNHPEMVRVLARAGRALRVARGRG
jgi:hypothetical protein